MSSTRTYQVGGPPAPVRLHTEKADGTVAVEHAAWLECGTCLAIAAPAALKWHYPGAASASSSAKASHAQA